MIVFSLIFLTCILHVAWNVSVKKCHDSEAFTWLSTFGGAVVCSLGLLASRIWFPAPIQPRLVMMCAVSGFFEACYYIFLFWSYKHIDLSAAYPLGRGIAPLFTLFLAPVSAMLFHLPGHHGLRLGQLPAVLVALAGALLLCYDAFKQARIKQDAQKGLTLALLTGLSISGYHLVDSQAMATFNPHEFVYLGLMMPCMLCFVSIWMICKKNAIPRIVAEWRASRKGALAVSIVPNMNYALVLWAFSLAKNTTLVTAARNMGIVISLAVGYFFLREKVTPVKILGATLITIGIVWIFLV